MAHALWRLSTLFGGLAGCTNSAVTVSGLTFLERPEVTLTVEKLSGPVADDGFGSAVAAGMGKVWIGAPHGEDGILYVWDGTELVSQIQGGGRLGSHLATSEDTLWVASPVHERVLDESGTIIHQGLPGMGIALADSGYAAWASGWVGPDGSTGETTGRPTAIHARDGGVGIGMAHGDVAFAVGSQQWLRPRESDEAGFAVTSGQMGDTTVWIVGAPASGHVYALDKATLAIVATWSGSGRFGHAVAVADLNSDGRDDLVVGAPFDGDTGSVVVFYSLAAQGTPIETSDCAAAGTALDVGDGRLLIGAPGDQTVKGRVFMVSMQG